MNIYEKIGIWASVIFFFGIIFVGCYYEFKDLYSFEHYKYVCSRKKALFLIEDYILRLNGYGFEDFMEYVFRSAGYRVEKTQRSRDGGKDLILNGNTYVELKRYANKSTVGKDIVKKLYATCVADGVSDAIIITTNTYTRDAIELIKDFSTKGVYIERWYMRDVLELIESTDMIKLLQHIGYSMDSIKAMSVQE